jgi:5'-deoxynucleotidase YfbR-like HD superfamily hydrolase
MIKDAFNLLRSGRVTRWHTNGDMRYVEHNDEHQWMTAMLALHLKPDLSRAGIVYALTHDSGEMATVDAPGPLKSGNSGLKNLLSVMERSALAKLIDTPLVSPEDQHVVHLADKLAAHIVYMREEPLRYSRDDSLSHEAGNLMSNAHYGDAIRKLWQQWHDHYGV